MQPLYFNPLDSTGNFIGTNPLGTAGVPVKTSFYPYFNPSIYQSFTFSNFPLQTLYSTVLIGSNLAGTQTFVGGLQSFVLGGFNNGAIAFSTMEVYSLVDIVSTQCSTFETFYANFYQLQPVTYSVRFGTQLQPLIASTSGVETWNTYEFCWSHQTCFYSFVVATWFSDSSGWQYKDSNPISGLSTYISQPSVFFASILSTFTQPLSPGLTTVGSSSFVNLMGSNVYSGLMDTTNSIIIYQNEQVSSYYSQSLSYQVNIANLTAALNSVSGSGAAAKGEGLIPVTNFSWAWESTAQGWTGSQLTTFDGYLSTAVEVNIYLSLTYGGTVILNSTLAVTQVQSLITVQNNDLSNSQTFMNNAVTTLQSQVSLAGQIIGTLSSIMQSIINNI